MTPLPQEFCTQTRQLMGEERFQRYLESFRQEPPVSIRLNPRKMANGRCVVEDAEPVPWCRHAYYLPTRPNFTMDPLLHAGCYYVQEAASMFLDEVLRQHLTSDILLFTSLDLCAAPGGKSTLLRAALPADCMLYSNEPIRNRANVLLENVTKWGYENHIVTNAYPRDYRKSKMKFDLILCDVPCSGEGMFRKDESTISEWSPQHVEQCWQLQRDIINNAWACLNDGGLLIYSTCTFNTKENEENIRWILHEFDAEVLPVAVRPEWHITGSLLPDFDKPVYRFIPGISRGEGLFVCVLRKKQNHGDSHNIQLHSCHKSRSHDTQKDCPRELHPLQSEILYGDYPHVELSYPQAIAYLRHEALMLSNDTPRGLIEVCFQSHPLGPAKNIGTRANNLYPKEWRIKTTHIPTNYEAILRHT